MITLVSIGFFDQFLIKANFFEKCLFNTYKINFKFQKFYKYYCQKDKNYYYSYQIIISVIVCSYINKTLYYKSVLFHRIRRKK